MHQGFPTTKLRLPRLFAIAVAAIAVFSLSLIQAGAAGAETGGVGAGGTSAGNGSSSSSEAAATKYTRIWNDFSGADRRWAAQTSDCESGGDPDAIGGGGAYRGAFQFLKSTWKASPKSPGGDPIDFDYRTQAVVAVLLKQRDGAGHWPVCG